MIQGRDRMGLFLNSKIPFINYSTMVADPYFVDKSALLGELLPALCMKNRYFCITRPRRFGKSVMASMVASFFGKAEDGRKLFDCLAIADNTDYSSHVSCHNVIFIDFSRMPQFCDSYLVYMERIVNGIKADLKGEYPELPIDTEQALWDILQLVFDKIGQRFIFVIDEWDALFDKSFVTDENKKDYLEFLRELLKDQVYVELTYMTGVLPIAKYSSGSELNMFLEYDMATKKKFSEYFGFSDSEVDRLFEVYVTKTEYPAISREDLRIWYDGYYTAAGIRMYNPHSVVCALSDNELANYWTGSGPYDEIFYYIRHNIDAVRDDIAFMASGERRPIMLRGYGAAETDLRTKNQIYSAMVVYGLLTYENKAVSIPNKELMDKFNELILENDHLGYVHRLAKESDRMLNATLSGDTDTMAEILEYVHDTESPILTYNNETELSAVVNLIYLSARDRYRVEREDKAGEGYVDFIFYPEMGNEDALILELKVDSTPKEAIRQIIDKKYALRFAGKLGERPKYTGRILAVGISYDRKTKKHACQIERIRL